MTSFPEAPRATERPHRGAAGSVRAPRGSLDRPEPVTVSFPGAEGSICGMALRRADVAQLAEQRFCKPQVPGSSPVVGSSANNACRVHHGRRSVTGYVPVGRLSRW